MIKVTATIKVEFELEHADQEMIKEALYDLVSLKIEEDELMDDIKLKLTNTDEEEDIEFDDEEDS